MQQTLRYRYASSNAASRTNNPAFITEVAIGLSEELGRPISEPEQRFLINFIKSIDPIKYNKLPLEVVKTQLIANLIPKIKQNFACEQPSIDVHEILKKEIGTTSERPTAGYGFMKTSSNIGGFEGLEPEKLITDATLDDIRKEINPQSKIRHNYLFLDSRYRITSYGQISKFQWNYINNLSRDQGSANTYGTIRDIISLRVMPIRIPYLADADTDLQRVSMYIEELAPQGYVAHENRRFHFLFSVETSGNWMNLYAPDYNDGYYHFDDPVTRLDSFTISFGSPLEPLVFDPDRAKYTIVYGALVTTITTDIDHNIITGDVVHFSDFTTTNPVADAEIISIINRSQGHHITFVANNVFTIPINSAGTNPVPPGVNVNVYFDAKRLIIPMEITYLSPE